MRYKSMRYV